MATPVTHFQTTLTTAMTSSQTTVSLNSIQTKDTPAHTITMSDLGAIFYAVIEPGSANEEIISFTGITDNLDGSGVLTGVTRGLKYYGITDGALAGNAKAHASNVTVIFSNVKNVYALFTSSEDNETITGTWTFSTSPTVPTGGTGTQAANATDIANAITGVSGTATNLVAGTTKLSVAAVSAPNPIAVGDNDTRVSPVSLATVTAGQVAALPGNNTDIAVGTGNKFMTQTGSQKQAENYATSTTGNDTYVVTLSPVPASYAAGMVVRMKPDTANTGAATINVNNLGAKSILKNGAAALLDNDITANTIVTLVYDGTQFILQGTVPALLIGGTSADTLHIHTNAACGSTTYNTTATNGTTNSDETIVCGFQPSVIELSYYIQGHDSASGFADYSHKSGLITYSGATAVGSFEVYNNHGAANNANLTAINTSAAGFTSATAPSTGASSGTGAIQMTLSVNSVSATGFVVRRQTIANEVNANVARANYTWKAWR